MRARCTRLVVALALLAGLCACGGGQEATVTVIVPWAKGGAEYNAFYNVARPFAEKDHFKLDIEYTPAFAQQLEADSATGNLPDLVDLPSPGAVAQYENENPRANGGVALKPLSINLSDYDQPWQGLAESSRTVYAVPVKADIKSLIWYKKGALAGRSWAALEDASRSGTPWCLGLADGSSSGWPGDDWVADIVLSKYGVPAYRNWLEGTWAPGTVGDAWGIWGGLIRDGRAVPGGPSAALDTPFGSTTAASGCALTHGALSAMFPPPRSLAGYTHEQFPSISGRPAPILVSGDFMGLFTGNQYARDLLTYLASDPAQKRWVNQRGYAFSADNLVKPGDYPRPEQGIASLLMPDPDRTLCFSAGDVMTTDLSGAFEQAILDYVAKPDLLGSLLAGLQRTANGNRARSPVAEKACESP